MDQVIRLYDPQRLQIPVADVLYLEGANNYSVLHRLHGKPILNSRTLKRWEAELTSFVRIHKHYLVNPLFVDSTYWPSRKDLLLRLTTGKELLVSRRRMTVITQMFTQLLNRTT